MHSSEIIPVAYFPPLSHAVTAHCLNQYQNLHLHLHPTLMLLYLYEVIQFAHVYRCLFRPCEKENAFHVQADTFSSVMPFIETGSRFFE